MKIGVIGAGVVGQATARDLLSKGHTIVYVDVNEARVRALQEAGSLAFTPDDPALAEHVGDISLFTVSTPTVDGRIALQHLEAAARDLGKRLATHKQYHLVVVRSTVPPGTTETLVIPTIEEASGKKAGRDFGVCMNPEFLREESAAEDFSNPWVIVIGQYDERSGDALAEAYRGFTCPVHRVSLREAEMQKYVHNLFNAVKITFFNEMREVCRKLSIDAQTVFALVAQSAEGMWNPSYGTRDRGPFSGMCLPKDAQAFLAWAQERNLDVSLLETTIKVNEALRQNHQPSGPSSVPVPAVVATGETAVSLSAS